MSKQKVLDIVFFRLHQICLSQNYKNHFFVYYCHIFGILNPNYHKRKKASPLTL